MIRSPCPGDVGRQQPSGCVVLQISPLKGRQMVRLQKFSVKIQEKAVVRVSSTKSRAVESPVRGRAPR